MERKITFGGRSALLCAGEGRALLTVHQSTLPVKLADALNNADDVTVSEVVRMGEDSAVRMVHNLTPSDILGVVCEAIGKVYAADVTVSYARAEGTV